MSEEVPTYEVAPKPFVGMSKHISESKCPASWGDLFVLNDDCGRAHIVPSSSVVLSEVDNGTWVFRTVGGDFKPVSNDPILEMIMDGVREFAALPTTYQVELQKR